MDRLRCCFSSSCGLSDLPIDIGIFSREIYPSTISRGEIDSLSGELRRYRVRRDTLLRSVARTMSITNGESIALETQSILETTSAPSTDNGTNGSSGLTIGAKAGIAIAAVCSVAVGVLLYLRWRRRNLRKNSSLETGNRQTSRHRRRRQKQQDKQHKQDQKQLQQQRQHQLQKEKLQLQEEKQKQLFKTQKQQHEESKYVAELFELPGWMPERRTPVNELADTGRPRYEMTADEIIAELDGGSLEIDNENYHIYGRHFQRSSSYTTEVSGRTPVPPGPADDDEELPPLNRSQLDGRPIISPISPVSPVDHISPDFRRVFSPLDVSPSTPTIPGMVFSRDDWRLGGSAQLPTSSLNPNFDPATPLGLSIDTRRPGGITGKRSKGQRVDGRVRQTSPPREDERHRHNLPGIEHNT